MAVSLTNPLPQSLVPPNFHVCSLAYGHPIPLSHCLNALRLLPTGSVAVPYSTLLPQTQERFALPFTAIRSLCQITIEIGGRDVPPVVNLVPDKIEELASFVLAQCVREQETGGFATMGLGLLVDYVMNGREEEGGGGIDRSPYSTTLPYFITVTVNNPTVKVPAPGNNDPEVPLLLSRKLSDAAKTAAKGSQLPVGALADAAFWQTAGETVASAVQIAMTWHGIRDVLDYLHDLCLMVGMVLPVVGGRAFIHSGPAVSGALGKRDVHARRSALNTLPPHVNITIYEQQEAFVNPRVEEKSCTWRAVQERKPISGCK
ncbi:MAG: hypothetical protein Q9187_006636 [Circinaria calcarea]